NANVYEGTVDIAGSAGSQVQYKFVINQAGNLVWEVNGVGPNGAQNRTLNVPASAQTLPIVHFNNQATPPGVTAVTFQVNMSVQQAIGRFDPGAHTVEAHGSFDSWGPGITLAASQADPLVYQGTVNITGSAGALYEYKFVLNQAGTQIWEGSVGPGGPFGNRVLTLGTGTQILPVVFFDNLTNNPGAGIPVTFRVNMAVQVARGLFDVGAGSLAVAGPFNNWQPTSLLSNSLADPYLYEGTVNISTVSPGGSVPFKFVANGGTWESGVDRTFVLADTAQTLPVEYFDRVNNLGPLVVSLDSPSEGAKVVNVTWSSGPRIRLQTATRPNPAGWQDVPGSEGQGSYSVDLTFETDVPPMFFRLIGP
ncbi:MAG TPA: hypothetical protein VNO52_01230, partial [Methylomirabilota bacterium]|nr:hypothetical protein [Methylomirabilota bacterium]